MNFESTRKIFRSIVLLIALSLVAPVMAQKDANAKKILDATAKKINNASGIEATYKLTGFVGSAEQGSGTGTILLKGKKYQISTGDQISWFDGKTLWNYSADIEEVSVTTPTRKELQSMNPYAFVTLYKKGYNYTMQKATYNGKEMYDVKLTAENKNSDIPEIIITITKEYTPVCIRMRQGKNWSRITVTKFNTSKNFSDATFTFPASKYPDAEVIDMR